MKSEVSGERLQEAIHENKEVQPRTVDVEKSSTANSDTHHVKTAGGIKNVATAKLTTGVLEEEARKKRRLLVGGNDNLKSLFTSSETPQKQRNVDFMTRGFTITASDRQPRQ